MRRFLLIATLANVAFIGFGLFGCQSDINVESASISADCLVKASTNNGVAIAGSYIVTYQPTQSLPVVPNARVAAAEVMATKFLTNYAIANPQAEILASGEQTSFLAHLTESESEKLRQDPSVTLVEPDYAGRTRPDHVYVQLRGRSNYLNPYLERSANRVWPG